MATPLPRMTYETLDRAIQGARGHIARIAPHTIALDGPRDVSGAPTIVVRLYDHHIATLYANGDIDLYDGGYPTATTVRRLAAFLPDGWHIWRKGGRVWVFNGPCTRNDTAYCASDYPGVTILAARRASA